ncbi:MAG: Hsp70 family protein, partial [SAR324 cluster bacterium]|nr:Hsp70 family protein [SAR324 cluster bacterium]
MNKFCGLDFGTSNSTVGLKKNTGFALANLEGDSPIIPSAIFFDKEEHVKLFGKKAIEKYIEGQDGRLMQSIKSILGSDLMHKGTFVIDKKVKFQDVIG